ncbi:hypothetical protein N7510_004361 [Penicillium lagena]|uniref:uncharacterized protein n=1 Tax=Penicillium lagena TaxID=94218 RepID=UPI0025425A83|nr:uncharacterized protein N7510_004361 [Penicillium lagena]KAJ5620377.1 hypothetical protein N7510_004361 [Penicillium lagena]
MSRLAPRSSWMTILAMSLLARLIPDNTNYLSSVFAALDLLQTLEPKATSEKGKPINESYPHKSNSTPSSTSSHNSTSIERSTQMSTPTPIADATLAPNPTPVSSDDGVSYTKTFTHGSSDYKPVKNLEVGPGENNGKLTINDIPRIFRALYKTLSDRFRERLDSSDEVSLRR